MNIIKYSEKKKIELVKFANMDFSLVTKSSVPNIVLKKGPLTL